MGCRIAMNRLPWAPLNASVFVVILGSVMLVSLFAGLGIPTGLALVFAVFGAWMIVEGFVIPPANAYAPPRSMVVGWGALVFGLGALLLVLIVAAGLLIVVFAVLLVVVGIAGVGYSFRRSAPPAPKTPTS
jgi:hypothetical protein